MNSNQDPVSVVNVTQATFETEVLRSKLPVVVACWAAWSRPCQVLGPVLEEVATECDGRARMVKVNADDNPDLSLWYEVDSIPTLLYFVRGNLCARLVGTATKEAILARLESRVKDET